VLSLTLSSGSVWIRTVVYGTDLDKITGRVKLSVVGYGRKTQEGGDTLGGRSATELSALLALVLVTPISLRFCSVCAA
jgi:hypothetical protein